MQSPTHGKVNTEQMIALMNDFYKRNLKYDSAYEMTVGTDSQNFSDTKIVKVLAFVCVGHGGIYFYEVTHVPKISDVRVKLNYETQLSLDLANEVMDILTTNKEYEDLFISSHFAIHVDAGESDIGKTKELLPSIVGWIKACDYDYVVKPDSYAASTIADRISK